MSEEEIKKLADEVWEQIASAYHWGDGYTSAYQSLLSALQKVNNE
jgi:hypothetical protein